jgi:hypothetical protein
LKDQITRLNRLEETSEDDFRLSALAYKVHR